MPFGNPDELDYHVTISTALGVARRYPDCCILFCDVDLRYRYRGKFKFRPILEEYIALGCKGFGENLAGTAIDDRMNQVIFGHCGEPGLPMVLHLDDHIN